MEDVVYGMISFGEERELAQASFEYIKKDISDIKNRYISLGFHLNEALTMKFHQDFGYDDFYEFCEKNFQMDKSAVSRSINLWKEFADYDEKANLRMIFIDEKYRQYSYSQLCEMLSLDEKERKKITPDMTVKQIREKKKEWKKKNAVVQNDKASVATSQPENIKKSDIELIKPNKEQKKYFDAFAKYFITVERDWILKDFEKRASNVMTIPEEIKICFCVENRTWYFHVVDKEKCARINLFDDYVQLWNENNEYMGDFEWFYLASAIQRMWNVVALEVVATSQSELPVMKNNSQRKEWLENYKDWGLWYRDEHIDVNYYKYDFMDGSRLIVEEYPQRERYWSKEKVDEYFFHLLEKNRQKYDLKSTYDAPYKHAPDSETYLVDFLKKLQKK